LNRGNAGKMFYSQFGIKKDDTFKEKRRSYMIGNQLAKGNHKPKSKEHCLKISISNKKYGTRPWISKIGKANKGRLKSEEQKRQISESLRRFHARHEDRKRFPSRSIPV
jgi:hypothetical protein